MKIQIEHVVLLSEHVLGPGSKEGEGGKYGRREGVTMESYFIQNTKQKDAFTVQERGGGPGGETA